MEKVSKFDLVRKSQGEFKDIFDTARRQGKSGENFEHILRRAFRIFGGLHW